MPSFATVFAQMRSGEWLDRTRVAAYGRILLAIEVAVFLFLIAGTHGWVVPLDHPLTTDFASFYAAGDLANSDAPALAYNQAAHFAAEQRVTEPGIQYQFFYYPPVFLLICSLLARMPYLVAFIVFEGVSLALYLLVARRILGESGHAMLAPLLAFPSVLWTLGLGQNALLTATLFGAGTLLVDRRPGWAGIMFGAICYKPHLGLLIPVALIAGRRWRTFATAAATVAALVAASIGLFGWETWQAYLTAAIDSHSTYELGRINLAFMISPFGALRVLGGDVGPAYAVQGLATLTAVALVGFVWWRNMSREIRCAVLAATTIVAVPVILLYDLMLGAVAAAWLIRAARQTGFLPWEKTALVAAYTIPLVALTAGQRGHVPLAPLAAILLLAMIMARANQAPAGRRQTVAGTTGA
ncbi:MAG: DUF2029 domain-containing protein [Alphaproteobacteria bacterium]|nr:DUF2029 domain-containing protein [Alphaproteobacteria bacterium]